MPDAYGNPTEAERRMMGYAPPTQAGGTYTPMAPAATYNNGHHFAGTNVPMSDAAYALLSNNGTTAIATDRDVSGQGIEDKVGNAVKFEFDRAGNLIKGVANDPSRLVTGVDPLSTSLHNSVLGTDKKPLVGQLGGATEADYNRYEGQHGFGSLGAARSGTDAANYISGMFGAAGAANGIGNAFGSLGNGAGSDPSGWIADFAPSDAGGAGGAGWGGGTQSGLGVFGNGGQGGMAGVGGGNAGALAARGGILGGAGVGIGGSLGGGSGLLSQDSIGNAGQLHDLLGGGNDSRGGGAMPYGMGNLGGMLGSQVQPQQRAAPQYAALNTSTPMYIPSRGYNPRDFYGAKVWT